MKRGHHATSASRTAELVALVRALGGLDPDAERFIGRDLRLAAAALRRLDPRGRALDRLTLGLSAAVRARHRWLDGVVVERLADDAEQLVLLGAGFDTRAARLAPHIAGRPIYHVDHPATAAARAARAGPTPAHVRRVDVDFAAEDFADALDAAGFAWDRPAVFIWEGVTMYLPRPTIEATLTRIAHRAAPGTRVGLDLVVRPEDYRTPLREHLARLALAALREPIVGIVPADELDALFSRAGLAPRQLLSCAEVPGGAGAWHGLWLAEVAVPR